MRQIRTVTPDLFDEHRLAQAQPSMVPDAGIELFVTMRAARSAR
jgi:hypothetical protein